MKTRWYTIYANYTNFIYNILIIDFSTPQVFKIILLDGCLQKLKIYHNILITIYFPVKRRTGSRVEETIGVETDRVSSGRRAAVTDGPGIWDWDVRLLRDGDDNIQCHGPPLRAVHSHSTLWREADIFLFTHCLELRTTGQEHTERHVGTAQQFCSIMSGRQMTQEMPPDPDTFAMSHE